MSRLLPLLFVTACGFAGADQSSPDGPGLASPRATRVEVVELQPSDATIQLLLPGEILGARDVVLAAGNGGLVEALKVRRGEEVRKGQAIARIDTSLYGAQVNQAEAQAKQAQDELTRQERMGDLAAPVALENARTQALVAEAALDQARARLYRAAISAPFAGTVADTFVEAGEHASPGSPVARLVELDPVRVTLSVADRDVVTLDEGMEVEVRSNARAGVWTGTITHVGPAADLRTRSFPVEVTVDNPDRSLLPGMIAQVRVHRTVAEDSVVVPQDWIVTNRTDQGVFIEQDGAAVWRSVTLGDVAGDQVVVSSGIEHGDRVVITGHRDLKDGEPLLVARTGTCCVDGRPSWE